MLGTVPLQPLVDLVGQPEQREFPQRGQVPRPEVVGERGVDLLRRVDVAVRHPAAQRLGGHVDELNLVGGPDHRVGHRLALRHAGDLLDHVGDRLEVLDVDGGDHVDAGVEQLVDVLPAFLVPRARHVRVRELVHQRDLRLAGEHRVDVHLFPLAAPVGQLLARDDLKPLDQRSRLRPPVRLSETDDHIRAALRPPVPLREQGVRLPDPGSGAKVNAQLPARCNAALAVSGHTFNSAATLQVISTDLTTSMRFSFWRRTPGAIGCPYTRGPPPRGRWMSRAAHRFWPCGTPEPGAELLVPGCPKTIRCWPHTPQKQL